MKNIRKSCYFCLHFNEIKFLYSLQDADRFSGFPNAYFRRRAEAKRAEVFSAWLGAAWHACILDE